VPLGNKTIFAADFQSLSLFRIVFATYLLAHFCLLEWPCFAEIYGDNGILPAATLAADRFTGFWLVWPMLRAFEAARIPALLPVLYPAALLAFAIGYRTRWATAVVFVLSSYVFLHNPYVLSGAELLAHLLLLWCLFLPLDRYWSIDAALDPRPRNRPYPLLPFLALRLQIASVYVFAGLFKLAMPSWLDGSAVIWALQDNVFGGRVAGLYLVEHVPLLLSAATIPIIALQLAFPFLVYCPWRNDLTRGFALAATAAMHASFIVCLTLGGFPYISLTMLLLLIPDRWLERALRARRARLGRVAIYYEPGCVFCHKVSLVLREFLLSPTAVVRPASVDAKVLRLLKKNRSWVVRGANRALLLKWRALTYLLRQNPLLAPLGWLAERPALRAAGDRFYDFIGRHRRGLGAMTKIILPFRRPPPPGRSAQALCGVLAVLALTINIVGIEPPAFGTAGGDQPVRFAHRAPRWLVELAVDSQVWQGWPLFTPPPHWRRDYRFVARDANGAGSDLMARLPMPPVREEAGGRLVFPDSRWLKFFTQFNLLSDRDWASFGRYLCRAAQDATAPPASAVTAIDLTTTTRPIDGTPASGMPPDQSRRFECRPVRGAAGTNRPPRPYTADEGLLTRGGRT
jgi:hypothetical protein